MRKTLIVLGCLSLGLAHAQQNGREHAQHTGAEKRVGINTDKPVATLELSKVSGVPTTQVQGFLLPHLDQAERNAMEKEALTNGLMIFNTTKNCIDWWDGAHWQCTDGRFKDEHGDDFNPVKSFTGNYTHPITTQDFTRNNCVAPQTGTTVSFTSQAITKTYVSNISQEDANEKAKEQALAEFNQLGQTFANQNGQCETPLPETTAITLPNGITIDNGQRIIASIFDTDYLPYSAPTTLASWNNVAPIAADGAADKTIDYQGKVTTTGLSVTIPVKTTGSGTVPAYKTYVNIPAERTEDGQARVLELSWESQAFDTTTKSIKATIKSVGGDLNVKKLDLVGGLGSDYKGLELGTFVMPQSATDGNLPANYKGKYELRVISGIPDKNFANETIVNGENKGYLHQFIYLPVQAPDGKLWLNNNLGADYSNINSPHFDPAKQAETINDYKAYGSLYQWQRPSDGHELVTWTSATTGTLSPTTNNLSNNANWTAGHANFITNYYSSYGWVSNSIVNSSSNKNLWQANGANNPCPKGFHVPIKAEWAAFIQTLSVNDYDRAGYISPLLIPSPGIRSYDSRLRQESVYWTSESIDYVGYVVKFDSNVNAQGGLFVSYGLPVRCIRD